MSTAVLRTAIQFDLFTHIAAGANTVSALAEAASISPRGARTMLDAMTGLGLITVEDRTYANGPEAETFLVKTSPRYAGEMVTFTTSMAPRWGDFDEAVRTGVPVMEVFGLDDHEYWDGLVPGIAPLSLPVARTAVADLGIADAGPIHILDIAGGLGFFCGAFLQANPEATAVQIDWRRVNKMAREHAEKTGVADRFETMDGDFRSLDFGEEVYDYIIYSQSAHGFSKEDNVATFRRIRKALKPGGTLVIAEYLVNSDGGGHPWVLLFSANILFHSPDGCGWRLDEYEEWLSETGFGAVEVAQTPMPAELIYVKRS